MAKETKAHFRLVDYIFQIGLADNVNLIDRILPIISHAEGSQADLSVVPPSNTVSEPPGSPPHSLSLFHPIGNHYQAETTMRFPKQDYSETEKFPAFLPMFCFPNDLKLIHDDSGRPEDSFHSFVITEEMGARCYGFCMTIYEKPNKNVLSQMDTLINDWRATNLQESDLEYAKHVQGQLAFFKEKLLKAKNGIWDEEEMEDPKEAIATCEEKILLYEELLKPLKQTLFVDLDHIYQPKCIGVLTHWPWYNLLKDWLSLLIRGLRERTISSIERAFVNLVHEIPLPPPGKLELGISISNRTLYCARPPVNSISTLRNFSLHPLFRSLSLANIISLYECALVEKKIIFVSSYTSMLAPACEALTQLMFPFYWHHIFIPVLPARLISYLQAPVPYMVGVNRRYFPIEVRDEWKPTDAVTVDLDKDIVELQGAPPSLPQRERRKLISRLEKHLGTIGGQSLASKDIPVEESKTFKGVPSYMKTAFPKDTLVCHTRESYLEYRKVHDILKSTYTKYTNEFLNAKAPGKKKPMPLQAGVSTSFDLMGRTTAISARKPPSAGPIKGKQLAPAIGSSGSILSIDTASFGNLTESAAELKEPPSSVPNYLKVSLPVISPLRESVNSNDRSDDGYISQLPSDLSVIDSTFAVEKPLPPIDSIHLDAPSSEGHASESDRGDQDESPQMSTRASSETPDKPPEILRAKTPSVKKSWWKSNKEETSSPSPTTSPSFTNMFNFGTSKSNVTSKRPSLSAAAGTSSTIPEETQTGFFAKILPATPYQGDFSDNILDSAEDLHSESLPHIEPEKIYHREGHIFHQLIPVKQDREVDIGAGESESGTHSPHTAEAEDEVDRFGVESQSSDEYTRSEASTAIDSRSGVHRIPSKNIGNTLTVDAKRKGSGSAVQQGARKLDIKRLDQFYICHYCRLELKREGDTVCMCELCHIQIHTSCLDLSDCHPCALVFSEDKIRAQFLKIFTSLFKNYRTYVKNTAVPTRNLSWLKSSKPTEPAKPSPQDKDDDFFRRHDFLTSEFDTETRAFMSQFVETQAFAQFVLDRFERSEGDYEILLFDESIKAKLNRSKLRFTKDATPFLKETSYAISTTIMALPPLSDSSISRKSSVVLATPSMSIQSLLEWKDDRVIEPRQVAPLLTESDYTIMRSHTNELIQRARVNYRQKQDLSKWMRSKVKQFQKMGNGEVIGLGIMPEDERKELLETRLHQVNLVIDEYEKVHISSQTTNQVIDALEVLHDQNLSLLRAMDEEQLVDSGEQDEVQLVLNRLIRVITIYEDYQARLRDSNAHHLTEAVNQADSIDQTPETSRQGSSSILHEISGQDMDSLMQSTEDMIVQYDAQVQPERPKKNPKRPKSLGQKVAEWAAEVQVTPLVLPELPPPPVALEDGKFMSSTFLHFEPNVWADSDIIASNVPGPIPNSPSNDHHQEPTPSNDQEPTPNNDQEPSNNTNNAK